jgi:hypothetical protein
MRRDGADQTRLTELDGGHTFEWETDSARIVLSAKVGSNWEIFSAEADGSGVIRLTSDPDVDGWPHWRP